MQTNAAVTPTRPSPWRRVRRTLLFALAVLALLAAGWSWLWHIAAGRTEGAISAAIEREARAGRSLTCGSRQVSGYPFAITVTCDKPKLEVARPAGKMVLAGQLVSATTGIDALGHLVVKAEGPVAIEAPGLSEAEAQWRSFTIEAVLKLSGLDHAVLTLDAPSFRQRNGQNMIASTADLVELQARPDPQRPPADDALLITGKLTRLVSPILDALSGETSAADGELEASVSRASVALRPTEPPPPALERWRAAGGSAHIRSAVITKGPIKVAAAGDVSLDEAHRLSGHIDAMLEGVDALAQRLQIPKIGINIIKLSGGKLRAPVELSDGRVTVTLGPVAIALPVMLVPLY